MTVGGTPERQRRRWPWLVALGGLLILLAVYVGHAPLLSVLGQYLVVEQPLEKADALLVLSGGTPFRAMEAAELYRQGWAPAILLTRGRPDEADAALQKLGIDHPAEYEYNRHVLLRLDVPSEAIVLLDKPIVNTWDELTIAAHWLDKHAGHQIIIVTSKTHTRRVALMWGHAQPGTQRGIVRWTPQDPFDPQQAWWKERRFAFIVLWEYLGLLNYWLGFPV